MIRIDGGEIIDVVMYSDTQVIFAKKRHDIDPNKYRASYFMLNFETGEKEALTADVYKMKKFGPQYKNICKHIANYVSCDAVILEDNRVLVMFAGGEAGLFDENGEMVWQKKFAHNKSPMQSPAADDACFWCVCPEANTVIRYNAENFGTDIRIGSKNSGTFHTPQFASSDENFVYICCSDKVRKINKHDLIVSDVENLFDIPKRFYKFGRFSILCMNDGLYVDKDV